MNPVRGNPVARKLSRVTGRRLQFVFVEPSGADLKTLADWISEGRVRPVIDRCDPLERAAEAQRYSETRRVRGKLVLVVDERLAAEERGISASSADAVSGAS